jgi:MerR family copper efflux transcriptional regulator
MTGFTIQDVSRRSGLSEPTLRYYEQVGLVGPIDRDEHSGHRRYRAEDLHTLEALACLRLGYLREKAALWDARDRGDAAAEAVAAERSRAAGRRLVAPR